MVQIEVNQTRLKAWQRLSRREVNRVGRAVARCLRLGAAKNVSVAFVSAEEIRRLNRVYRGKNYSTDVLAFALSADDTKGEVLICYEKAKQQAAEESHAIKTEILILFVHGLLHVFGYDHKTSREAKKMFSMQTRILKRLDILWQAL